MSLKNRNARSISSTVSIDTMHPNEPGRTAGGSGERDPRRCEADRAGSEGATRVGLVGSADSPLTEANFRGTGGIRGGRASVVESPDVEAKILPPLLLLRSDERDGEPRRSAGFPVPRTAGPREAAGEGGMGGRVFFPRGEGSMAEVEEEKKEEEELSREFRE